MDQTFLLLDSLRLRLSVGGLALPDADILLQYYGGMPS